MKNLLIRSTLLTGLAVSGLVACQSTPTLQPQTLKTNTLSISANFENTFQAKYRGINPFNNADAAINASHWAINDKVTASVTATLQQAGYKVLATGGRYQLNIIPARYKDYAFGIKHETLEGYGVFRRYSVFDEGVAAYASYKVTITDTTNGQVVDTRYGQFQQRLSLDSWPEFYWKNQQQGFPEGSDAKFNEVISKHFARVNPLQLTNINPNENKFERRNR